MLDREGLVFELFAVDRFAASTVARGEVASLAHKANGEWKLVSDVAHPWSNTQHTPLDYTMEG